MNHPISFNEIVTTAAKALFALGVPPGVDIENGRNIAWLEANKLGGISILAKEIEKLDGLKDWPIPTIEDNGEGLIIKPSIHSILSLVQTSIDFAETGRTVTIERCSTPLLIFAEAARRVTKRYAFKLTWEKNGIKMQGTCAVGQCDINALAQIKSETADVTIKRAKPKPSGSTTTNNNVYQQSLSNGIIVDEASWNIINRYAKKILVPSNIHSRASAGAEVDDSN